jgi:hypothetical protein
MPLLFAPTIRRRVGESARFPVGCPACRTTSDTLIAGRGAAFLDWSDAYRLSEQFAPAGSALGPPLDAPMRAGAPHL